MAFATRTIRKTTELKPVEVEHKEIQLTLTWIEAETLKAVVGSVAGNPTQSYRKHTRSVYNALNEAGVATWPESSPADAYLSGQLNFRLGGV